VAAEPVPAPTTPAAASATAAAESDDLAAVTVPAARVQVPLGGPSRGPETAKVNLVVFADFQCPFCGRIQPTLLQIAAEYATDLRIFFRHDPLPFHESAPLAAEAAVAAAAQGQFWEMHDRLFADQQSLDRASLERYAEETGLDMAKFRAALDGHLGKAAVDADAALALRIGVPGTPTMFANGLPIQGAQSYAVIKKVIDDEIARADVLLARGTARAELYATFIKGAPAAMPPRPPGREAGTDVYKVPVGDAPRRGGIEPKVTIIEFADFQCPYSKRVGATLVQLLEDYGGDLEIRYRHSPLLMHADAMPAALAAEAAREQGKFWEMHDTLFDNQHSLDRASLDGYARAIGLDMRAFKQSMDGKQGKDRIKRDMDEAVRFGASGTPNFFVNGRNFRGAQPIEAFKRLIEEEIKKADAKLAEGTPRPQLYAALTQGGLERAPQSRRR